LKIDRANAEAVGRMIEAHPVLVGLRPALEVIPGMQEDLILHAGPPIIWEQMAGPMRGAVVGAILFEGRARTEAEAVAQIVSGGVRLEPCHHHQAVGPMAGVTTPSMPVYVVENRTHGNRAFCSLNEGYGKVLRFGAFSPEVLDRLAWMRDVAAPVFSSAIEAAGGIDLRTLIAEALQMGDEGHNRNRAASNLLMKALAPSVARCAPSAEIASSVLQFMADNAIGALNPIMAACKAMADAAQEVEDSTLVYAMARNGTDFGIRVSGMGDRWFTAPVAVPQGLFFPGFRAEDAAGDLGDSTITETAGIGGFAMAAAPAIVAFVGGSPKDATNTTLEMYEITSAEHRYFSIPSLGFRGTPVGIDIRKVVELGITPRVNTGIAHREPGIGQIGAGLVRPPLAAFEAALVAYAETYGY